MNGYEGTFEMVDPALLVVDHRYQRIEKTALIDQIAGEFDWRAFGVPTVFKRPSGVMYVADGQQRVTALKKARDNGADVPRRVPVIIFPIDDVTDEAEVFVRINEWRKGLTPMEKHKSKTVAKDPATLSINRALEKTGYSFGMGGGNTNEARTIMAIAGVGVIYNRLGEEGLVQTLTVIRETWPDDPTAVSTHILRGVAEIIEEQGDQYARSTLVSKLKRTTPAAVLRKADEFKFDFGGSKLSNIRRAFKALAKV